MRNPTELEKLRRDVKKNAGKLRESLVRKALAGDAQAMRLCLEQLEKLELKEAGR